MQQQKQLTQNDDWQMRLAERMASKEWKDRDPILESLAEDERAFFILTLICHDQKWLRRGWLLNPANLFLIWLIGLCLCFPYIPNPSVSETLKIIMNGCLLGIFLLFLIEFFKRNSWQKVTRRHACTAKVLKAALAQTSHSDILTPLLQFRPHLRTKEQQVTDDALMHILTRMSGEAVFALPFELRTELARLAEHTRPMDTPRTPENLSIVILLALTSARDGNVQPVLRRLSKDARSLRLREVAAECLREFSAAP